MYSYDYDDGYAEYYENLVEFAERLGFTEDDISYLRHIGYTLEDIEDYLYEAHPRQGRYYECESADLVPMYM